MPPASGREREPVERAQSPDQRTDAGRQRVTVADEARQGGEGALSGGEMRIGAQRLFLTPRRARAGVGPEAAHVVEEAAMVLGIFDDRANRGMARMRAVDHRLYLALEIL